MDDQLQLLLGEPVADVEEEAFILFSQAIPSQSLGFLDSQASVVNVTVAGRDLSIHQSRGLLTSDRSAGTTGAVVWKVTPFFAEWIASSAFLARAGYLTPDATAIELGAGVSGIVALTLGPRIRKYIATDQDYVIRLLKQNIAENLPGTSSKTGTKKSKNKQKRPLATSKTSTSNIETLELDWELDSIASLPSLLGQDRADSANDSDGVDLVIACDCIYNDALIEPLNTTCAQICRLRSDENRQPTLCLIAQQLRSPEVFEEWLKSFHRMFHVWRVPDELLTEPLRENSGFVVHVGVLR
ncbi:hypothetical protein BDV95DRAFT_601880 [Massariosphaeria phaeospora]|uniref:Methyltransferase-domain-containing protein n=1 Tax=Massariosphaeria phaeospora TaxID=100035 RepID=A0A7C8IIU6_9PLEO|nr:hypothetical protein BDV95DRAFT_601880 [Massariosphaeria phaeospora]